MGTTGIDKDDVELQVAEIQRKYRIMEGSRRSYSEDSQATIRRQRATIEQLKADNTKLKEQLQLETKVCTKESSGDSSGFKCFLNHVLLHIVFDL